MTGKKSWTQTVAGWFVVQEGAEDGTTESAASDGLEANPPAPTAPLPVEPKTEPPAATGGAVDFDAVFAAFGIENEARERVTKAADLLRNLPAGADPTVKKQIVEASLQAFGVPIDSIIESAVELLQALEAYQRRQGDRLAASSAEAQARITALDEEIQTIRRSMQQRVEEQQTVVKTCNGRKLEIQAVLEFFGQEAVARVVRESPKLVVPDAPQNPPAR